MAPVPIALLAKQPSERVFSLVWVTRREVNLPHVITTRTLHRVVLRWILDAPLGFVVLAQQGFQRSSG